MAELADAMSTCITENACSIAPLAQVLDGFLPCTCFVLQFANCRAFRLPLWLHSIPLDGALRDHTTTIYMEIPANCSSKQRQ